MPYGETEAPKSEKCRTNPMNKYGKMKLEVEEMFNQSDQFKSIRLSYIFSSEDKFTKFVCKSAENKNKIELFDPLVRNIVWRNDIAEGIGSIQKKWRNQAPNNKFWRP